MENVAKDCFGKKVEVRRIPSCVELVTKPSGIAIILMLARHTLEDFANDIVIMIRVGFLISPQSSCDQCSSLKASAGIMLLAVLIITLSVLNLALHCRLVRINLNNCNIFKGVNSQQCKAIW